VDGRGELLGEFKGDDMLLVVTQKGVAKTFIPNLSTHFDEDMVVLEKWNPNKPLSAIYFEGEKDRYYVKRFLIENENKEELFISEHPKSFLELVSTDWRPVVEIEYAKPRGKEVRPNQIVDLEEFISIKGIKALGNQLTSDKVKNMNALESLPYDEPEESKTSEIEVVDEENVASTESPKSNTDKTTDEKPKKSENPSEEDDDEGQITLF